MAGKAAIVARRRFWPNSEPWPREWEENDLWFEKRSGTGREEEGLEGAAGRKAASPSSSSSSSSSCPVEMGSAAE